MFREPVEILLVGMLRLAGDFQFLPTKKCIQTLPWEAY